MFLLLSKDPQTVSEELNSVETGHIFRHRGGSMRVSEELNSVETLWKRNPKRPNRQKFQKNLIVWKPIFLSPPFSFRLVSEELNSVETGIHKVEVSADGYVSEELNSVET